MKKILALLLTLTMIVGLGIMVNAESNGTGTVTISLNGDAEDGNSYVYTIYRVFDADIATDASGNSTGINYKLVTGKTEAPTGFTAVNGYITEAPAAIDDTVIANIKAYVTDADIAGTITLSASKTSDSVTLPYGYYYITTTTGTVIMIDSTNTDLTIQDKNPLPTIEKTASAPSVSIGSEVTYTVKITAQKGAKNYVFHDQLSAGLTLKPDSLTVSIDAANYTVTKFENTAADGEDDITITFKDEYLATLTAATEITITYTATVNENAIVDGTGNANDASLDYGEGHNVEAEEVVVKTYDFTVKKTDGTNTLTGAEFKLYDAATGGNEIFVQTASDGSYYVDTSATSGVVIPAGETTVKGLAAGTYYLEETKAPDGYNMLTERQTVTITEDQTAPVEVTVVNEAGTVLPSTGGIGTTIFYIVGGLLAVSAGVVLVTKKRMGKES